MKTLLVGMGNPILCDDAVGVRLAQDFKKKLSTHPHLDVIEECSVGGLNLLDLFAGYERVIVLDSFHTADGKPGKWYFFSVEALCETIHLTNIHDTNLATALELGRRMGMVLPDLTNILIFGVEIKDNLTFSERMSPELEMGYPRYSSQILEEIETLLSSDAAERFPARSEPEYGYPNTASGSCGY
jgi:hydrogenase maturation protease